MSKRIITAIAIAMVMILAGTAAVYAIGSRPEEKGADKNAGAASLSTAPAEEVIQTELVKEINLAPFNFPMGTKAEAILRDVLSKKEMSARDIEYYNSTPDEVKQLDYNQARTKEADVGQILKNIEKKPWEEWTDKDNEELFQLYQLYDQYKDYADSIATGMELARVKYRKIKKSVCMSLGDSICSITLRGDTSRYQYVSKALFEFMKLVVEDMEEELADDNGDYQTLINRIDYLNYYITSKARDDYMSVSEEDFARYTQQYLNGVPLEEILG